jgi:hypothetical protein
MGQFGDRTVGLARESSPMMKNLSCILAVALGVVLLDGPAREAAAGGSDTLEIVMVLAAKGERRIDPRLHWMRRELRTLPFKNYRLVETQSQRLHSGGQCGVELPGGGFLQIINTESTPEHLNMRVLVNQRNRPLVNTVLKLDRGAGVMFAGPKGEKGTLLIRISSPPGVGAK